MRLLARRAVEVYASTSTRYPHAVAGASACGVMTSADITCQLMLQPDPNGSLDWQRALGISVFAGWHYGVPAKFLYLWYDRFFGVAPTLRTAVTKMLVDVYLHGAILLVPSFYVITGTVKGQSLQEVAQQYRSEWFTATFGTAAYWTPLCILNFRYVPQHSRILVVAALSFVHKTWMSWLSNRARHSERRSSLQAG
jgi:hypothetical protein